MGLSLKGPQKQGADVLDEGAMTRDIVARYATEDGLDGNAEAAKVLPARRHLWRLLETYAPRQLAAALRARLDTKDQTGRGGVRELRRALADWLDPPPACGHCGRLLSPDIVAANPRGLPCPTRLAAEAARRTATGASRRPTPKPNRVLVCAPPRGPRPVYGTLARPGPARASGVARCGTLALFAPTVLDPACAASVKMMKHGGASAYDLAVDRDARILFAVTGDAWDGQRIDNAIHEIGEHLIQAGGAGHGEARASDIAVFHDNHYSTITTARLTLDRTLDRAVRANARLALKTQLKYFSPKGSTTRADLVQAAMMGLRRALLDYDPNFTPKGKKSGVKISSYAIAWIHQHMGEEFAERDVVVVPQWAVALRRRVADMGISPGQLLAQVLAVAEARVLAPRCSAAANDLTLVLAHHGGDVLDTAKHERQIASALLPSVEEEEHGSVGPNAKHDDATDGRVVGVADDRHRGVGNGAGGDFHVCQTSTSARLAHAANARPPKSKKPVSDERSREQVAAVVVDLLRLDCTGGALLTALRHGAPPQFVPVSTGGERDDAGDGEESHGRNTGLEHLHARPDGENEEDAAIAEAEDRRRMSGLLDALATLRESDPEAAEVVRRRHGLDAAGDEETLEQIGERLHSTGRALCREAVRVAYKRGVKAMQALAGVTMPDATTTPAIDDADDIPGPSRHRHSVLRPLRPVDVRVILASPPVPVPAYDNAPGDPEAWTAAALVF